MYGKPSTLDSQLYNSFAFMSCVHTKLNLWEITETLNSSLSVFVKVAMRRILDIIFMFVSVVLL